MNSRRIQFRSSEYSSKKHTVFKTSNLSTGDSSGEGVNRGAAGSDGEGERERKREEMERSIREGRHKEISLSRIFDQPLRRANSLVRNNWITSKRGPLSTGKEKVPEKVLEKDRWEKKVRVYPFVENNNL